MRTIQSPAGATYPYYYKGGEFFGFHLGSFAANEDGAIARMRSEADFLCEQGRALGIWIDLYDTRLSERVMAEFVTMLDRLRPQTLKLGLVGCSWLDRWKLNRRIRRAAGLAGLDVKYFADPEDAKTWLVSEGE